MAIKWNRTFEDDKSDIEALSTDVLPTEDCFGKRLKGGSTAFLIDTQELKVFEYESATWIPNN